MKNKKSLYIQVFAGVLIGLLIYLAIGYGLGKIIMNGFLIKLGLNIMTSNVPTVILLINTISSITIFILSKKRYVAMARGVVVVVVLLTLFVCLYKLGVV